MAAAATTIAAGATFTATIPTTTTAAYLYALHTFSCWRLMRVALEEKHPPRLILHCEAISAVIEGKKKHNNMGGHTQTTRHDTVQDHAFLLLYCDLTS